MKRYVTIILFSFIIGGSMLLKACKHEIYVYPVTPVAFVVPAGWPAPKYDFTSNPLTKEGIELGRYLFYDGRLSKDGNYPCASCHQQDALFTHEDHALAHGYGGQSTTRNPVSIANMAWYAEYFQDGSKMKLEDVYTFHITAPNEMAETVENVIARLRSDDNYRKMFRAAFGDATINAERMNKALSQFVLTIVSSNSKFDRVKKGQASFTLPEQLGYDIFNTKCSTCHKEPFFTDFSYRNIGMPLDNFLKDKGRMFVTNNAADSLKFRVLSLRNAQVTRPFGHDGRFFSFTNMYIHYNSGLVNGPTTDPLVAGKIPLSNFEQGQLTAFLNTLTDSTLLTDPRFSKP
jgi:cytochrome c peroxidase